MSATRPYSDVTICIDEPNWGNSILPPVLDVEFERGSEGWIVLHYNRVWMDVEPGSDITMGAEGVTIFGSRKYRQNN